MANSDIWNLLTSGCGDESCANPYCRSSHQFRYPALGEDQLLGVAESLSLCPGPYACHDYVFTASDIVGRGEELTEDVLRASASYYLRSGNVSRLCEFFGLTGQDMTAEIWADVTEKARSSLAVMRRTQSDSLIEESSLGLGAALLSIQIQGAAMPSRLVSLLSVVLVTWPFQSISCGQLLLQRVGRCIRSLCPVSGSSLPQPRPDLLRLFSSLLTTEDLVTVLSHYRSRASSICRRHTRPLPAPAVSDLQDCATVMSLVWRPVRRPLSPSYMAIPSADFLVPLAPVLDLDAEWRLFREGSPLLLRFPFLFSTEDKLCFLRAEATTAQKSIWGSAQEVSVGDVRSSAAHDDLLRHSHNRVAIVPSGILGNVLPFTVIWTLSAERSRQRRRARPGTASPPPSVPLEKFCFIRLKRDSAIVDSTLRQLDKLRRQRDLVEGENPLLRPLYVEFEDEGAIDQGGVTREFFQLLSQELFKPDGALFSSADSNQFLSFRRNVTPVPELQRRFFLVGVILGLALFNNVLLDMSLPSFVYRRLLGKKPTMRDLSDFKPEVYEGLRSLLEYDGSEGSVESAFCLDYSVTESGADGRPVRVDLRPDGSNIPVTEENRTDYVQHLVNYLVGSGVDAQMRPFAQGFREVVGSLVSIHLFTPEDLERALTGSKQLDWEALRSNATYDNGYTKDSPQMVWFWDVVLHDLTETERRQLLQFVTGCSRAPVGGLSKVHMKVVQQGRPDQLPTSHTCMDILCIPPYESREQLCERLRTAIPNCVGFGFK